MFNDPRDNITSPERLTKVSKDFKQHVRGALRRRRLHMGDWVEDAVVVTCTQTLSSSGPDVYSAGNFLATRSRTIEQALVTHPLKLNLRLRFNILRKF